MTASIGFIKDWCLMSLMFIETISQIFETCTIILYFSWVLKSEIFSNKLRVLDIWKERNWKRDIQSKDRDRGRGGVKGQQWYSALLNSSESWWKSTHTHVHTHLHTDMSWLHLPLFSHFYTRTHTERKPAILTVHGCELSYWTHTQTHKELHWNPYIWINRLLLTVVDGLQPFGGCANSLCVC